jgi:hypothetical protein
MALIFHFIYGLSSFPLTHIFHDGYCTTSLSLSLEFPGDEKPAIPSLKHRHLKTMAPASMEPKAALKHSSSTPNYEIFSWWFPQTVICFVANM